MRPIHVRTRRESRSYGDEGIDVLMPPNPFAEERDETVVFTPHAGTPERSVEGSVRQKLEDVLIENEKILGAYLREISTADSAFREKIKAHVEKLDRDFVDLRRRLVSYRGKDRASTAALLDEYRRDVERFRLDMERLLEDKE